MGSTQFGNFHIFVANNQPPNRAYGGCALTGIDLSRGRNLGNLGMVDLAAFETDNGKADIAQGRLSWRLSQY
ncbi:hypothetical protein Plec18170_002604 [Paecilomyces lecythidis]